jgi:hypothetical protein
MTDPNRKSRFLTMELYLGCKHLVSHYDKTVQGDGVPHNRR